MVERSGLGWPLAHAEVTVPPIGLGWPDVSRETSGETGPPTAALSQPLAIGPSGSPVVELGVGELGVPVADDGLGEVVDSQDDTPLAREIAVDTRRRRALHGQRLPTPANTRVITIANQKGGVGKTTTTVNMAAALAQGGLLVLVLDLDPQGNTSTALGIAHHSEVPSIYDVLVDARPLGEVIAPCPDVTGLFCAPATIDLAGAEIELVSMVAREGRLLRALDAYLRERESQGLPRLDYVLIDCPPSLGLLTVNALVSAQEVFIPIQCEYYALEGLSQLLKNIDLVKAHLNPELRVSTMLMTMFDGRTRLSAEVAEQVREHFPDLVLRASVPRSVRISEAPSHGQTVMTYDPGSSGALSYLEAARELAHRGVPTDGNIHAMASSAPAATAGSSIKGASS